MTWKNRPMTAALIVCLVAAMLAGCTGNQQNQEENNTPKADTATDSTDPFSLSADNKMIADALAKVETPEYFKNTPTYEYTVQFPTSPEKEGSFGQQYFEKKFNVKLKFVPLDSTNRNEQLNTMFATGTIPDFLSYIPLLNVSEYANQGLLAEVPMDMIEKNMPNYYPQIEKADLFQSVQIDGKNMALPFYAAKGGVPLTANIRADWLTNVGINKVPQTLDELEEAFKRFRNDDPDKNGKKDTYALSNASTEDGEIWFQSIFGAYGTNPFLWVERDGKLQFGFTTNETKEALKRLHSWYEMELISPEFITDNARSTEVEDLATKFSEGKIGYMDNLGFEDSQWDNDGHINYRWVKNSPEWQKFFEDNKNNPDTMYATKLFTDFNDQVPQPIYINLPSLTGPNGAKGFYRSGFQGSPMVFGKQMEKDPEKLAKLLRIVDYITSDEEAYLYLSYGIDGLEWKSDEKGRRLLNPDWVKHALYDPGYKKLGDWILNPVQNTNPEFFSVIGGPRADQRYKLTMDVINTFPSYENKLGIVLPSAAKYSEITDTRIKEYVVKAIAGDIDIDGTFNDAVNRWYKDGGDQLTKEANDWLQSVK
ncbi:extracellular solute-binding protein [Paenibacillus sepulcri]|uniref:Extracellular solute-binding protein n=1 Tax=Paenibacillus sepulcri TaxID=359917 RepID=A0ABS7BX29_9BACL|nr:extracellular solute-binding protein [Paenibacillus sepulcri]